MDESPRTVFVFPSPQGGSETVSYLAAQAAWLLFPSPQGGSETRFLDLMAAKTQRFHPLKAGRRPEILPEAAGEL